MPLGPNMKPEEIQAALNVWLGQVPQGELPNDKATAEMSQLQVNLLLIVITLLIDIREDARGRSGSINKALDVLQERVETLQNVEPEA